MAKQVIWSQRAAKELNEILIFWIEHNKFNTYSKKLSKLFEEATQLVAIHPNTGRLTDYKNVRYKIVRDYLMMYEVLGNQIHILTIWDNRQNPEKLEVR